MGLEGLLLCVLHSVALHVLSEVNVGMQGCLHFRMYVFLSCVCKLKIKVFKTVILDAFLWGKET